MSGYKRNFARTVLCVFTFLATVSLCAQTAPQKNILTIHYHRYDGDYDNPGIWTWDGIGKKTPKQQEIFPVGKDDFGPIFHLDLDKYGLDNEHDKIGLLPRLNKDWNKKDGGDRYWTPELGRNVYLVEGKSIVFEKRPDISPKLLTGYIDADTEITALLTRKMPRAKIKPETFTLIDDKGKPVKIVKAVPIPRNASSTRKVRIILGESLAYKTHSYTLSAKGFPSSRPRNVIPRKILSDPNKFYDPAVVLGASYSKEKTTFRLFAPTADNVFVVIYHKSKEKEGRREFAMQKRPKGIWEKTVPGNLKNKYYMYRLKGADFDPNLEVVDIYARCVSTNGGRGIIVDLASTNPPGFEPTKKPPVKNRTDAIIYELHIHDFTIAPNSGVKQKGLFLGLTETGTHLPGEPSIKTALDHLTALGVTHVQLMPIQDFDNDETVFHASNWGYMPVNFNSPEGWFATKKDDTTRITEFKRLVQTLHEKGIRVIMDVVYNHTAPAASFNKIVPNYYFRKRDDGSYYNGSGCGNEFKSENPMARKFILDSLKYWVTEYGIDGFRFDLMGLIDLKTMTDAARMLHEIDPSILIYGEPWASGTSGLKSLTDMGKQKGRGFGAFNAHIRDAIKGSPSGSDPGFIQAGNRTRDIIKGIEGAIHDWTKNPDEAIAYCACHDDYTLWDKIAKTAKVSAKEREKMQKLAAAIVFTSQGPTFIHSGQEMCRTKKGNPNTYSASEEINQINWQWKKEHRGVFNYYKGMIALRKAHPSFRLPNRTEIKKRLKFDTNLPSPKTVAFTLDAAGVPGETCKKIYVIFNADTKPLTFNLPPGEWKIIVKGAKAGTKVPGKATKTVKVASRSALICLQ